MNISSIWSLVFTTSSLQMALFYNSKKKVDLKETLNELEPFFGLPGISEYDYIVVGGGAAGCLIAGKLSEAGFSVLLLEKGGDPPPPIMSQLLSNVRHDTIVNEFYEIVPQAHAYGATQGTGKAIFGVMLGGSSAHNNLKYNRGSPQTYDEWAEIVGDPSLSYGSMLQYYKEIEDMQGFLFNDNERLEFYGNSGPFSVETDLSQSFGDWFEAGKLLGFRAADPNAHMEQSFTTIQSSTKNATRETSCTAFIFRRPNPHLKILRFSNAIKILTEGTTAVGVVYLRHGITQVSLTKREVIVTAGPLGSPILLLRSGIGPGELLQKAEIPVVLDLPGVGAFLQDHPGVFVRFQQKSLDLSDKQMISFLKSFPGGEGATGAQGLQAFIRSSVAPWRGGWPDVQVMMLENPLEPTKLAFSIYLNRPLSTGSLWINTTALSLNEVDSTRIVKLDPSYFAFKEDIDAIIEGMEFLSNGLLETPPFKVRRLTFVGNLMEGCESYGQFSREFWICFVQRRAQTGWHFVGTARMGRIGDELRVVDSNFRVVGLEGLRVADSSVMPKVPNSNTQAPTLALANKAVHAILTFKNAFIGTDK